MPCRRRRVVVRAEDDAAGGVPARQGGHDVLGTPGHDDSVLERVSAHAGLHLHAETERPQLRHQIVADHVAVCAADGRRSVAGDALEMPPCPIGAERVGRRRCRQGRGRPLEGPREPQRCHEDHEAADASEPCPSLRDRGVVEGSVHVVSLSPSLPRCKDTCAHILCKEKCAQSHVGTSGESRDKAQCTMICAH